MAVKLTIAACAMLCGTAEAQAVHHGYIWLEGPEEVLLPNTTYTMEAWARWESPLFVEDTSGVAGFGIDIINTIGRDSVAGVGNVVIADWFAGFGTIGSIVESDIFGTSGGQLANLFGGPLNPNFNFDNPILLFTFDFTTADEPVAVLEFTPANPNPNGGLSFYPISTDGQSIIAPNDSDSELHLIPWSYVVPAPSGVVVIGLAALVGLARRRR